MVTATAWAVPVITLAVATPAFAASANASLTLVWGNGSAARFTGDSLADATATVLSRGGSWDVGENVTFTVLSGPASFGGSATAVIPTGPAGTAMATGLTATGVGTVMLRASVSGLPTQTITINIQDSVVLTIDNPIQTPASGATTVLTGKLTVNGVPPTNPVNYPITLTITAGTAQFAFVGESGGLQSITNPSASGTGVFSSNQGAFPSPVGVVTANGYIGEVDVTASAPGAVTQTYKLLVGYLVTNRAINVGTGREGIGGFPYIDPVGGPLLAGTTLDVSYSDPGITPVPNSGWTMTSLGTTALGPNTYRFTTTVAMTSNGFVFPTPTFTAAPQWTALIYVLLLPPHERGWQINYPS
jgi:hypothetical protein